MEKIIVYDVFVFERFPKKKNQSKTMFSYFMTKSFKVPRRNRKMNIQIDVSKG